jgi:hypothetical protein
LQERDLLKCTGPEEWLLPRANDFAMTFNPTFLALAVSPMAFFGLWGYMKLAEVPRPPIYPLLFLCITASGWLIAPSLPPAGMAAHGIICLLTMAPFALLASSLFLVFRPERTRCHRLALIGGFLYAPALLIVWALKSMAD